MATVDNNTNHTSYQKFPKYLRSFSITGIFPQLLYIQICISSITPKISLSHYDNETANYLTLELSNTYPLLS